MDIDVKRRLQEIAGLPNTVIFESSQQESESVTNRLLGAPDKLLSYDGLNILRQHCTYQSHQNTSDLKKFLNGCTAEKLTQLAGARIRLVSTLSKQILAHKS